EAVALPSKASARTARNTQLILRNETGITDVIDPLGGSYYVENLTAELVRKASGIIHDIERAGGMRKALYGGGPKAAIEETAAARQARIDSKSTIIVGVNDFIAPDAGDIAVLTIDNEAVRHEQITRIASLKRNRDAAKVTQTLDALRNACQDSNAKLLPLCIEAARTRATTNEISQAMADVFDRYQTTQKAVQGVFSEAYEGLEFSELCERIKAFIAKHNAPPSIFVAKLGQDGHDRGAKVIASAYGDAGFDVHIGPLFQTPQEAAEMAIENKVHVIGVSSLAAAHNVLMPELMGALRNLGGDDIIVVCGGIIPPEDHKYLKQTGVKAIFGPGYAVTLSANDVLDLIEKALEI
ncbi:MAG: methylmalonyl-CoA mutase family protein, partial [Pseudomonadota bacterium]